MADDKHCLTPWSLHSAYYKHPPFPQEEFGGGNYMLPNIGVTRVGNAS